MRPKNGLAKFIKLYPGFAKYTYPQFQNSQKFALDGGVIFDTLVNSNKFHAGGVFNSALLVFNRSLTFEMNTFCV